MTTQITEPLFIQIARKRFHVASLAQASQLYCQARDISGEGASRVPEGKVVTAEGRLVARISYNGRVWPAENWYPSMTPLCEAQS